MELYSCIDNNAKLWSSLAAAADAVDEDNSNAMDVFAIIVAIDDDDVDDLIIDLIFLLLFFAEWWFILLFDTVLLNTGMS